MPSEPLYEHGPSPEALDRFSPTDDSFEVAMIELGTEPYVYSLDGEEIRSSRTLEQLSASSDYESQLTLTLDRRREVLRPLGALGPSVLYERICDQNRPLRFDEAYSAMTHIFTGSNKAVRRELNERYPGNGYDGPEDASFVSSVNLLRAFSDRESTLGFSGAELAGLVAATLEVDTVATVRKESEKAVFALGGMGGDEGIPHHGGKLKTCNVSTIAMAGLAELAPVHKHHSYPNTSKVAGQSAVEAMGARSDFESAQQANQLLEKTGIVASSCHSFRTVHSISHVLRRETINHAIGPLAIPHNPEQALRPLIGVNQNVHPDTIIDALAILEQRGVQHYDGIAAFAGIQPVNETDQATLLRPERYYQNPHIKESVLLDEVAPPPYHTLASFDTRHGRYTVIITPEDFMLDEEAEQLSLDAICIENDFNSIVQANSAALAGTDFDQSRYVAMTVALGEFLSEANEYPGAFNGQTVNRDLMRECYRRAVQSFESGRVGVRMSEYVAATQQRS